MIKKLVKRLFDRATPLLVDRLEWQLGTEIASEAVAQKTLMQQYRMLAALAPDRLPGFADAGFRKYSQFEEDGILLYIFSLVAPINRTCVEMCAGSGRQCNTANLIVNHGWWGWLFDGDAQRLDRPRVLRAAP
jgi:hypothetical protein